MSMEDRDVKNARPEDIIYAIEYDNGETYEDHLVWVDAAFRDYNDVLRYFRDKLDCKKCNREAVASFHEYGFLCTIDVKEEIWIPSEQDDYYDSVGFFKVKTFNSVNGEQLYDIIDIRNVSSVD